MRRPRVIAAPPAVPMAPFRIATARPPGVTAAPPAVPTAPPRIATARPRGLPVLPRGVPAPTRGPAARAPPIPRRPAPHRRHPRPDPGDTAASFELQPPSLWQGRGASAQAVDSVSPLAFFVSPSQSGLAAGLKREIPGRPGRHSPASARTRINPRIAPVAPRFPRPTRSVPNPIFSLLFQISMV